MANLDPTIAKETPPLLWLGDFDGVNLHDDRRAIGDQECAWLENLAPLGKADARAMYDIEAPFFNASPLTIVYEFTFNIGAVFYHSIFMSDGSAVAVKNSDNSVAVIGAAGTFTITPTLPHCAQWGASGIVIIAVNGLFAWDGTLFKPGDAAPSWLSGLAAPITFTGDTHSNTTVDNIVSTNGVVNGMMITDSNGDIPATTLVFSHTATGIVLSQAAIGSHAGGTLTINWMMPIGVVGSAIEIYVQRVWVFNGDHFSFSAPGNGTDFSTADGGGTVKSSDGFLHVRFVNARQSNGFLYVFGDGSINVISNVKTSGSPATTTFNNQNVDPQTGLGWRDTLVSYGRALVFANPSGVYALFGGAAEKVSDKIDRLFQKANFTATIPTACVVDIFNVRCYGILLNTFDPTTKTQRNLLSIWNGAKWYLGSQSLDTTFVTTMDQGGALPHMACGNDGKNAYELFSVPSSTLVKKVVTKLWGGTSFLIEKTTQDLYAESVGLNDTTVQITGTLDSDTNNPVPFSLSSLVNVFWLNNSNGLITFVNNLNQPLQFLSEPPGVQGTRANQAGRRLGLTLQSTSPDFELIGLGLTVNDNRFYGR